MTLLIGDLVWDTLDRKWARVTGIEPDGMIEVNGEFDLRNRAQVKLWSEM